MLVVKLGLFFLGGGASSKSPTSHASNSPPPWLLTVHRVQGLV